MLYDPLVRMEGDVIFVRGPEGWWWASLQNVARSIGRTPEEVLKDFLPVTGRYQNLRTRDGLLKVSVDDAGFDVEAPEGYNGPEGTGLSLEQIREFLDAVGGDVYVPRGWVVMVKRAIEEGIDFFRVERWQLSPGEEIDAEDERVWWWSRIDATHFWVIVPEYRQAPVAVR